MMDTNLLANHTPRELLDRALGEAGIPGLREALRQLSVDFDDDLGEGRLDVTSVAFIADDAKALAVMRSRKPGTLAGAVFLQAVLDAYGPCDVTLALQALDGQRVQPGQTVATFTGSLRDILSIERTALNLVCHLSGVATLTRSYVDAVAGTSARICETRKTLPGLRALQKWACRCGGALPHRHGLFDAMLVKDNHLAHVPPQALAQTLAEASARARKLNPSLKFIEVEVDTLEQLAVVLKAPVDLVLLDNMPPDLLRQAVAIRNQAAPKVGLEASGGVTLQSVRQIAGTGVDRISVGALTHSAPSLDLGLDIDSH
jgi:nicotinate-nucleotide pyrophosphorylase (carboxylating)